jgi:SNF2 family DNA or RNA helicase
MNIGKECYIYYDKYGGNNHGFHNELTINYEIKNLFENRIDDGVTEYLTGIDAIIRFNEKFGMMPNFKLPLDIDHDIITVHIFFFKNNDNCEIMITLLGLDTDKLTKYYTKYKTVPNKDLIITACRFHVSYEGIGQESSNHEDVVNEITKKVIVPSLDVMDPMIDHQSFMKPGKILYDYQRRTVKWMVNTENTQKKIHYGKNYKYEIKIGPLVYDIISKSLVMCDEQSYVEFNGGALIDEVGLGKTLQTLTLCLMNQAPPNVISYIDEDHRMLKSRGTLIICPNQLCGQWSREISTMISRTDLKIVSMLTKNHFDKYTYQDLLDADFVIVSYNFIGNNCFSNKFTNSISASKSYSKSAAWNQKSVEIVLNKMSEDLITNPMTLFQSEPLFHLIYWHRIVIDEFHEAYTVGKYVYVKNIIPLLKGHNKWVVTGTPFDKGTMCFYKMFDFVTNYTNSLDERIVNIDDVKDHMNTNFFRRNTKQSVEDEFKLPELKEKIIWLKFTHTERMMYNAYLTDPNVNRFSEIVRQICCHPKIADEIKGILSKCKTLGDIENSMVAHYRQQYNIAAKSVKKCEKYIAKTDRRILIVEYKRQRKFLKQKGYRVKIDLPQFHFDDYCQDDDDDQQECDDQDIKNHEDDNDDNDDNDGLNIDLSDDDDEDEDFNKPLIIVSSDNQHKIKSIIKRKLDSNPSLTIKNLEETLQQQKERLAIANNICNGKKASYNFFHNMLERIKKFTEKSKIKYEKLMIKNRMMDEMGSEYESDDESDYDDDDDDNCGICLNPISGEDVGVTKCGHIFCFECLKTSINNTHKCPMCAVPQNNSDISMISFEKPVYTRENSEILKTKLELIDNVGTKLTNLIYYLNSLSDHVIIFSQWDSLLRKVGDVLTEHGIKNVFCRGNVWTRDKAIREFNSDDKIKVIMLSSESAASGTNLTKASKVILLDPVSGNYEHRRNTEWQAIGRAYRLGQKNSVEVVRFIVKDTVEEEIYKDNKSEDNKQSSQIKINEVTDETITLSDEKLRSIAEASQQAKELKEQRIKDIAMRKEKLQANKSKTENEKLTKVVKKQ